MGEKHLFILKSSSTLALVIGLFVVNIMKPGAGLDYSKLEKGDVSQYTQNGGQGIDWMEFVTHIVPSNMVDAFCKR
ncbi:hypothetical protein BsIDN1_08870 [Bacillus safensis]|uniref:Uncharacterized protein n=1 Tax=Bacillus safensis TaxID=561879 RepID=A0A5S9M5T1_BACIA|nr:hypothetical protein BsIDN1_08870 [Bacillus safensis]